MAIDATYDSSAAVTYHYDKFPPAQQDLDYIRLITPLSNAAAAIARFDQMLKSTHNREIFLDPLRKREAVTSSRMEGTVSTMDEILRYEAEYGDEDINPTKTRADTIETFLYERAIKLAQNHIKDGRPINSWLIRALHEKLLSFGRGAEKNPGQFKSEQNYLADPIKRHILFTPISPERLPDGLERFFAYLDQSNHPSLLKVAISHVEFEALHPFKDGNGRIGRMLIPLYLWKEDVISTPHFYISDYMEEHKGQYIDLMRNVSEHNDWTSWCIFFLEAIEQQSIKNLKKLEDISNLYTEMKEVFKTTLSSKHHINALDFVFTHPIFSNTQFTKNGSIPQASAASLTRTLIEQGLLKTLEEPSGRRPGFYAFEPLLRLVRV